MAAKRKSRSDEGQAIHGKNARATSNMTAQRRSRRLCGLPPLIEFKNVGRYQVLGKYAPTLRCIFAKYGDIASSSNSPAFNSRLLMVVALIVHKLLRKGFCYVLSKLDDMKNLVQFATLSNLNVSWLVNDLAEIEKIRILTTSVATKDFNARKKIMMKAKKWFKKVQRHLDDLANVSAEA